MDWSWSHTTNTVNNSVTFVSVMLNHSLDQSSSSPHDVTGWTAACLLKPAAGWGGESVTVRGSSLQSCTLNPPWAICFRQEEEKKQQRTNYLEKNYKRRKSPEWRQCMGRAAETWRGQTVIWKESPRGGGGGGVKAKVSTTGVFGEVYVGDDIMLIFIFMWWVYLLW